MHSLINHADQVVNFLDWTTASLLGSSAVIIGQSMLARLRNEFVSNHLPESPRGLESEQSQTSEPEPESEPAPESANEPEPSPNPQPTVGDPWLTENTTACKLPKKEATGMVKHASNRRMLKEATLSTQDYQKMKKKKLIEIARAKGIPGANGKKNKRELVAKLSAAS